MKRVKKYLEQINDLQIEINLKKMEILQHRIDKYGVTAIDYGDRVITSPKNDSLVRIAIKSEEMDEEYNSLIGKRDLIIWQIRNMNNKKHANLLFNIYVNGESRMEIAKEWGYCYRQLLNIYNQSLEEFRDEYKDFI